MTFIVLGANSDFGVGSAPPIEDAVYNYLKNKWSLTSPTPFNNTILDADNHAWDSMGQYHMSVELLRSHGNRQSEPTGWIRYSSTLRIHLIMKRLTMGQISNDLAQATTEVEKNLWEYSPHWIAGIDQFDDFDASEIYEPTDNPAHPFNNTWHIVVDINAWYTKGTDFAIDIAAYNPAIHPAGSLTYL